MRIIGVSPTFRTEKRTTAKITYRRPRRPLVRIIRTVRPASRPYDLRFMRWIVGMLLVLPGVLNAPSTAHASNGCVRLGWAAEGARGLVAVRTGERLRLCGGAVADAAGLRNVTVVGPGWRGTLHSPETRVDGLVGVHALGSDTLEGGGHANLPQLRARLDTTRRNALRLRVVLATILIAFA